MEQEMTIEELIALINTQEGDFIIQVENGEDEADGERKDSGSCR